MEMRRTSRISTHIALRHATKQIYSLYNLGNYSDILLKTNAFELYKSENYLGTGPERF